MCDMGSEGPSPGDRKRRNLGPSDGSGRDKKTEGLKKKIELPKLLVRIKAAGRETV